MTAHSKFGASNAHRWLNCPGSIKLSAQVKASGSSEYAIEGTIAHKMAEVCLTSDLNPDQVEASQITTPEYYDLVSEDMREAVWVYYNYIKSKSGSVHVETKFDLSFIRENMFGTNDCIVYNELLGILEVIDYKHGAGIPVDPVENTQLAYYGLGAAKYLGIHHNTEIVLTVVQPRAMGESVKSWKTNTEYLKNFAEKLAKGVDDCLSDNPNLAMGSWCKFCPALAVCPKMHKASLEIAKAEFSESSPLPVLPAPESLQLIDIKKVLDFAPILGSWLKAVEQYAFIVAEEGQKIEGYKLVKKRANRIWKYEEPELIKALKNCNQQKIDKNWFTEPKLKSPAQLEKIVSKELIGNLVETPDNGNTLVSVLDKRQEVAPSSNNLKGKEFEIFEE